MDYTLLNLRPDSAEAGTLVPAGAPTVVSTRAWEGIGIIPTGDGNIVEFTRDGSTLGIAIYPAGSCPAEPAAAGDLGFTPTGVIEIAGGFMVAGDGGNMAIVRPDADGNLALLRDGDALPECFIEMTDRREITAPVAATRLTGAYSSHSTTLSPDDDAALSAAIARTYKATSAAATAAGGFLQPVLARYTVRDTEGNILFRSQPRLMPCGGADGRVADINVEVDDDGATTRQGMMHLSAYSLALRLPAVPLSATYYSRAASMEIEVTPQIHRADTEMTGTSRISAPAGERLRIAAPMPGTYTDEAFRLKLTRVTEGADELFKVVDTIRNPFAPGRGERLVAIPAARLTVKEEEAAIRRVAPPAAAPGDAVRARCSIPHRTAADVVARSGDIVLLANPASTLFEGHSARFFADTPRYTDTYEAVITVSNGAGTTRTVRYSAGRGDVPAKLSPLFSYPDPSMTEATIDVMASDGKCYTATLPLMPAGTFAYFLNPSLAPIELTPAPEGLEFNIPHPANTVKAFPGHVIAARPTLPFEPMATTSMPGRIVAINPAPRPAGYSLDSSASRFIVAGTGGIHSVGVGTSGRFTRPVTLDSRPVAGPGAVATVTAPGAETRLMMLAGGDLVEVTSSAVKTLLTAVASPDALLAWNPSHAELYIITPGKATARVYFPGTKRRQLNDGTVAARYLPDDITATLHAAGQCRISSPHTGYIDPAREVDGPTRCVISTPLPVKSTHPITGNTPVTEVIVDIASPAASGTLDIAASEGATTLINFARLNFNGPLNAPIAHRLMLPPRYKVSATFDALIAPGSVIRGIAARPL